MKHPIKICFVGSGAISTAFAQVLSNGRKHLIEMVSIESDVIDSINNEHINHKYFPSIRLHEGITATRDIGSLQSADVIFLGIPSTVTVDFMELHKDEIDPQAIQYYS